MITSQIVVIPRIFERLLDETSLRGDRGVVCFIGPPQWGKTWTVTEWARKNDRQVVRLLAQTMEPEAICGYDVKHPKTGELVWAAPSWLRTILAKPKDKWLLFIDELDKPREATLSALLTLLCDRIVQNCKLPDTVTIACAMNVPRAPLPQPLIERLLFVPFPTKDDLTNTIIPAMGALKSLAREYLEAPDISFPERTKNAGTMYRLKAWMECEAFWKDDDFRHSVVMGLVNVKDIPWWISKLDPKAFQGVDLVKWAETARPSDLRDSLITLLTHEKEQQKRFDILKVLCERANSDPSGELAQALSKEAERMDEVD